VSVAIPIDVLWNAREWAEAIARLPTELPLLCRTALVPRERVAHTLRRQMVRTGRVDLLAGTRFLTPATAAGEVLGAAGIMFTPGEEPLRSARLVALFRQGLSLEHFPLALLQDKPGWDEAFAATIGDLEAAGLRPGTLRERDVPRLSDIATVWEALDAAAGSSWTTARVVIEAAKVLEARSTLWPFAGATLAVASGETSAAEARFLLAIPGVHLALLAARPLRRHYLDRIQALFGREAADALVSAAAPRAAGSERDLLASYLFEPPEVLGDPAHALSDGPDGTVDLEEHAGVEAEVEATADWVTRQVMDGTALEEIAVLLPDLDPLAALVAERLERLPWPDGTFPVHVAGGLPLAGMAGGARALAVVRALRGHLNGEALAQVLPVLRTMAADERRLTHGAATDLVWSLGTAGGNAAHPDGALEWGARAEQRETDLAEQLAAAQTAADDPERSGLARTARDLERLLTDLRAVRTPLAALVDVARLIVRGEALATIWPALRGFLAEWLLQPGADARVHALLDARLGRAAADGAYGALVGDDALRVVEDALLGMQLPQGRFGDPAMYIGTVHGALGLTFVAVRVIGLAEGHFPPLPHEDPVLPDAARVEIGAATVANRSLAALHALDHAVRGATTRLALSAPRLDVERSQREPSFVLLEAAAAIGRPDAASRTRGAVIPDGQTLERDAFLPARRAALDLRRRAPLSEAAWHDAVAAGLLTVPPRWQGSLALDLDRIAVLRAAGIAGAIDGLLGAGAIEVPGLTPDRPISPSALEKLLRCPHLFLFQTLLGFEEPSTAPPLREIGQPAYGSFVHAVAEEFYRTHGAAFGARKRSLADWLDIAGALAERRFDAFLEQYPLVGGTVRRKERERLRTDLHDLLRSDWGAGARRFVGVERTFGQPVAVELDVGGRPLFVRGRIDRLDVEAGRTLVRDLKTGRAHPRLGSAAAPDAVRDIQLAMYGLVTGHLAGTWGLPARVAAAYTYVNRGVDERAFRDDFHQTLEPAAREWLGVAVGLLNARAFPRTTDANDCTYCCFKPVCGDGAQARAAQVLAGADGVLAAFRALKSDEDAEDED